MKRISARSCVVGSFAVLAFVGLNCAVTDGATGNEADANRSQAVDCDGVANCDIPASGAYFLTSFGYRRGFDDEVMSCGQSPRDGAWYYAASKQRYGCGAHIKIEAGGKCVVAETDDYGPAGWLEKDVGGPILDASPLVSEHLFGRKGAGWTDHLRVKVTQVDKSTPLGPCGGGGGGGGAGGEGGGGGGTGACASESGELPEGTCIATTGKQDTQYQCQGGMWLARWCKSLENLPCANGTSVPEVSFSGPGVNDCAR